MATVKIYLGQVPTTRRIKKLVLTGDENWVLQSINSYGIANFQTKLPARTGNAQIGLSSHLTIQTTLISATTTEGFLLSSGTDLYLRIDTERASTTTELKAYLAAQYSAGTPIVIWYILAESETAITNEPLCKIGDYADTLTSEQAGITIPTTDGNNTISVDTALAPSRFEIKVHAKPI